MDLEKVDLMCEIDSLKRGWSACEAERDRLRAERDAARDENAGLREALEEANSKLYEHHNLTNIEALYRAGLGGTCIPCSGNPNIFQKIATALARTSDQHRKAIEAGVLRRIDEQIARERDSYILAFGSLDAEDVLKIIRAEAERLEKEGGMSCQKSKCGWESHRDEEIQSLNARIAQLTADLAEARRDSEDLDWLEMAGLTTHNRNQVDPFRVVHKWGPAISGECRWTVTHLGSDFKTLRAAIRAARGAK